MFKFIYSSPKSFSVLFTLTYNINFYYKKSPLIFLPASLLISRLEKELHENSDNLFIKTVILVKLQVF